MHSIFFRFNLSKVYGIIIFIFINVDLYRYAINKKVSIIIFAFCKLLKLFNISRNKFYNERKKYFIYRLVWGKFQ